MYTATYLTVCYGWRVGMAKSIDIVNATAPPLVTLPYLTLPYFTLPYLKLVYTVPFEYYITLDQPTFRP